MMRVVTDEARNALVTLAQYVAGYGVVVSGEQADAALKTILTEFDQIDANGIEADKAALFHVVVGFVVGVGAVLSILLAGRTHP